MAKDVLEIVEVFAKQGHSGVSANYCLGLLTKLLDYKPLSPLTGEDSEWEDVFEYGGDDMHYQNKRCSRVFKDKNGRTYDIQGKVFIEPDGISYTSRDSIVDVIFPYTPETQYVKVAK